jgi:hypothetical protein
MSSWIPYRYRMQYQSWRTDRHLRDVYRLPPVRPAKPADADAELHVMLGKFHLTRTLAAVKLFFGHSGLEDRVSVVFHLDGSIDAGRRAVLEQHVIGARYTDWPSTAPEVHDLLARHESLHHFYHAHGSCVRRLVHIVAHAGSPRVISLDTDVMFFNKPARVVDWVRGRERTPLYLRESGSPPPSQKTRDTFADVFANMTSVELKTLRDFHLNAGLLLLPLDELDLRIADDFCRWRRKNPAPAAGFWFSDWNTDQTIMALQYSAWQGSAPLDDDYQCGATPARICSHFFGPTFFETPVLKHIGAALKALDHHGPR